MKCLNCGTEYSGGVCPNCGAQKLALKQYSNNTQNKKHGIGFYILIIFIGYIVLRFIALNFGNDQASDGNAKIVTEANAVTEAPIEYKVCDIDKMLDELDDNALKAEKKYTDMYIEITGKLNVIDSDGEYISVEPSDSGLFTDDIRCDIQDEVQINKILEMHRGDTITVRGKITSIGEVLGYSLDIDAIK
jgi:hypothetical protein